MKVRELVALLAETDPESVVVFLQIHAETSESDEVREVFTSPNLWTQERGCYFGEEYEIRYPGKPRFDDDIHRTNVQHSREHVVVLAAGETNLRYDSGWRGED